MATIIANREYTPDDLLTLPDERRFELVDGQLVEKEMGMWECRVACLLAGLLMVFVERTRLGSVFNSELFYRCFPFAPKQVRRPDISFIQRSRLPSFHSGIVTIAPDLAVEVVSPNDAYREVETKVEDYLRAGVRLVWVLNPQRGLIRIHRADGSIAEVGRDGELSGEDVLPGFTAAVGPLFELPSAA